MRTHYGPWQPCWITNQHQKHKSGRGPFLASLADFCSAFQRRRFKCEKLTDGRTEDAYPWQKLTWPMARWAKNGRSRKRKRQPENWKQNIRKRKRQAGSEYIDSKGETKRKKEMKLSQKDCNGSCKFKCSNKYSENDRKMFLISFGVIMIQKRMLSMAKTLRENKKVEHVQKTLNLGELFHMSTIFLNVMKGCVFVNNFSFLH